jgi:AhpD family alkylhydroperoxidase
LNSPADAAQGRPYIVLTQQKTFSLLGEIFLCGEPRASGKFWQLPPCWRKPAVLANVFAICFLHSENSMSTFGLIEYQDASPEVRAIYDDIMATRKTDWINNFWKAIAHDPATLKRTWESIKQIMGPGALDPLTKELIYIAVSVTNNCHYCIASHTASAFKKGMSDAMFKELQAVIGMANETNKLVTGYQVAVDKQFLPPLKR